jgi:AcrR family transcriptional regulator
VADAAGVDSRLVTHYFGSKQRLFLAVIEPPYDPRALLPGLLGGGQQDPSVAFAAFLAHMLDDPAYRETATGLIRAASSDVEAAALAAEFLTQRVLEPAAETLVSDHPNERAALIGSLVAGLVFGRHVLRLPALVEMDTEAVAKAIEPVLRCYLFEPLD